MEQNIDYKDFIVLRKTGIRIRDLVKAQEAADIIFKNVCSYFPENLTVNYFNVKCRQKWSEEYIGQIADCLQNVEWLFVKPSVSEREVPNLWVDYNDRLSSEQKKIMEEKILGASGKSYLFLRELSELCGQKIYKADVTRILDSMISETGCGKYSFCSKEGGCFRINGFGKSGE